MNLLLFLMIAVQPIHTNDTLGHELKQFGHNKQIPALIEKNVLKALSYYPELKDTRISFEFRMNLKTSVMQAQPVFGTLLKKRSRRSYRIKISSHFNLTHSFLPIEQVPDEVMVGWIGHELGHILDYESRTNRGIMGFGYRYLTSPEYVKQAEIIADTYAVNHGLGSWIIATKRFILDNADLPESYKKKIARLYLSPDAIMEQVKKLEEKKAEQQKAVSQ